MIVYPAAQKVLVTGANGLLGRKVVEAWRSVCDIHAVVRNMPQQPVEGVTYIEMDLARPMDVSRLPAKIDTVIHLAQSPHMREFPARGLDIYSVNTASTAQLLDWAHRADASHFLFASTGGVYRPSSTPFHENSPLEPPRGPLGFYFDTKLCSETLVRAYETLMHTVILRPFFIYGPGQAEMMLMPRLINNVRETQAIQLQGGQGTFLNPIMVDDAVSALAVSMDDGAPSVFNLAGPEVLSIREIALHIGSLVGREPVFDIMEGEPPSVVADITLLEKRLSQPMTSCRDGLKVTINGGAS